MPSAAYLSSIPHLPCSCSAPGTSINRLLPDLTLSAGSTQTCACTLTTEPILMASGRHTYQATELGRLREISQILTTDSQKSPPLMAMLHARPSLPIPPPPRQTSYAVVQDTVLWQGMHPWGTALHSTESSVKPRQDPPSLPDHTAPDEFPFLSTNPSSTEISHRDPKGAVPDWWQPTGRGWARWKLKSLLFSDGKGCVCFRVNVLALPSRRHASTAF